MSRIQKATAATTAALAVGSLLLAGGGTAFATGTPAVGSPTSSATSAHSAQAVLKATGTRGLAATAAGVGTPAQVTTEVKGASVTVRTPATASGALTSSAGMGSAGVSLVGAEDVPGVPAATGTVVYPNAARDTDLAVQATTDGGASALVTLKDGQAPSTQRFRFDLPSDTSLAGDGHGGYDIVRQADSGLVGVGHIDAPWAKDATGRPVPTRYALEGDTLVQSIDTNSSTVYPVVADPHFTWGIITGTAYFNRSETQTIAHNANWVNIIVPGIPSPWGELLEAYKELIKTTAEHADQMHLCIKIKSTASVGIYGGNDGDGYCR